MADRPGPESLKNLSQSATDLGLGDALANQVQSEVDSRRKKLLAQNGSNPSMFGDSVLGINSPLPKQDAARSLFL